MTPTDAAIAQAWRNRFISERMNAYPDDGYEVRRAKAEADANDFEDAFIAASANRARELDAAKGGEEAPVVFSYDPFPSRRTADLKWPDGRVLAYTLDLDRYTDTPEVIAATPPAQAAEAVERVERVARAMYEDECDGNYNPWGKAGKHSREVWLDRARAAIGAMGGGNG